MENLDFGNIAIGVGVVSFLNLIIVILIKTETILKYVEKIKSVIRLDYKYRAKRSDDELRIIKKHEAVARERIKRSFITINLWNCRWIWNWSNNFEPINIRGFCLGDSTRYDSFHCDHPVNPYFLFPKDTSDGNDKKSTPPPTFISLGLFCSQDGSYPHKTRRADFEILESASHNANSVEVFNSIITKAILSERDVRIANEIRKLRLQFWR